MPVGAPLGGQGRVQTETTEAGPGTHALLGSVGGVLWGSQARAGLDNLNQKEQGSWGSYVKDTQGKGPEDRGECLSQGSLGELYQELTVTCVCIGCYPLRALLMGQAIANSRLLQGHMKWIARQQN